MAKKEVKKTDWVKIIAIVLAVIFFFSWLSVALRTESKSSGFDVWDDRTDCLNEAMVDKYISISDCLYPRSCSSGLEECINCIDCAREVADGMPFRRENCNLLG